MTIHPSSAFTLNSFEYFFKFILILSTSTKTKRWNNYSYFESIEGTPLLIIVEFSSLDFKQPRAQLQQNTLHAPLPQHWKTGTLDPSRQVRVAKVGSTVPGQQIESIGVVWNMRKRANKQTFCIMFHNLEKNYPFQV